MTDAEHNDPLEALRARMKGAPARDAWSEMMGEDGLLYDANGEDRTGILTALLSRIEALTGEVVILSDRVKTLERHAIHDEARLAAEIEQLRSPRS